MSAKRKMMSAISGMFHAHDFERSDIARRVMALTNLKADQRDLLRLLGDLGWAACRFSVGFFATMGWSACRFSVGFFATMGWSACRFSVGFFATMGWSAC